MEELLNIRSASSFKDWMDVLDKSHKHCHIVFNQFGFILHGLKPLREKKVALIPL